MIFAWLLKIFYFLFHPCGYNCFVEREVERVIFEFVCNTKLVNGFVRKFIGLLIGNSATLFTDISVRLNIYLAARVVGFSDSETLTKQAE